MLLPTRLQLGSYQTSTTSIARAAGVQAGTTLTSGAANTKGSWTLLQSSITSGKSWFLERIVINAVKTSGGVISATTLNGMVDIGVGATAGAAETIIENLACPQAQGIGVSYNFRSPIRISGSHNLYGRFQCTAASAVCGVNPVYAEGQLGLCSSDFIKYIESIGEVLASTTGVAVTPGNAASGAWTEIIASTTQRYVGVMASPLFNVDTTLTSGLMTNCEVGLGASGQERPIGGIGAQSFIWSTAEQKEMVVTPSFITIPVGSRLVGRANGSGAADGTNSMILYGLIGG